MELLLDCSWARVVGLELLLDHFSAGTLDIYMRNQGGCICAIVVYYAKDRERSSSPCANVNIVSSLVDIEAEQQGLVVDSAMIDK